MKINLNPSFMFGFVIVSIDNDSKLSENTSCVVINNSIDSINCPNRKGFSKCMKKNRVMENEKINSPVYMIR